MPDYNTNNMTTDERALEALERAIIGLSSGLQEVEKDSAPYLELKTKIDELFGKWHDLHLKLNPCDIKLND